MVTFVFDKWNSHTHTHAHAHAHAHTHTHTGERLQKMLLKRNPGPVLGFLTLFWGVKSLQMTNWPMASTRWSDTSTVISKKSNFRPCHSQINRQRERRSTLCPRTFLDQRWSFIHGGSLCCRRLTCSAETTWMSAPLDAPRDVLTLWSLGLGHWGSVTQGNFPGWCRFMAEDTGRCFSLE